MGFHLRDIIGVGPMRYYVYIAGISITVAFPSLRFGLGPRGNIVHLVRNGLSYRFTPPPPSKTDSADETLSVKSSSHELLHELSTKRAKSRLWPVFAGITVFLLLLVLTRKPNLLVLAFYSIVGGAATLVAYHRDLMTKTVVLFYGFDEEMKEAYDQLHQAAKQVSDCAQVWHVASATSGHDPKYNAGADLLVNRAASFIRMEEPPYVKTNIETVAIGVGNQTLHFFPDRILVYDKNKVSSISYQDLAVAVCPKPFVETGPVPRDAVIVDRTWKYTNKGGGPDKRFRDNPEIPICRYEEIHLSSHSGLNELLQLSRCGYGDVFASAITRLAQAMTEEKTVPPSEL